MVKNYKVVCIRDFSIRSYIKFYKNKIYDTEFDETYSRPWTIISDLQEDIWLNDEHFNVNFKISVKETRKEKLKNIDAKSNM